MTSFPHSIIHFLIYFFRLTSNSYFYRSYLLNFQLAHIYLKEYELSRQQIDADNAMAAFQSCYQQHPKLGCHMQGSIHTLPSPSIITTWLNQKETWDEMIEPLGTNMKAPILSAECVSESFQRMSVTDQNLPETWYTVALAAMQSGNRPAAVAWALGALEKAPNVTGFSDLVRKQIVEWENEQFFEETNEQLLDPIDLEAEGIESYHVKGCERIQRWVRKLFRFQKYRHEAKATRWLRSLNTSAGKIQRLWKWHLWVVEWWK